MTKLQNLKNSVYVSGNYFDLNCLMYTVYSVQSFDSSFSCNFLLATQHVSTLSYTTMYQVFVTDKSRYKL